MLHSLQFINTDYTKRLLFVKRKITKKLLNLCAVSTKLHGIRLITLKLQNYKFHACIARASGGIIIVLIHHVWKEFKMPSCTQGGVGF